MNYRLKYVVFINKIITIILLLTILIISGCSQKNSMLTFPYSNWTVVPISSDIFLATSDILIDWEPVLKEEKTGKRLASYLGKGQYDIRFDEPKYYFKTAVEIREGRFDSQLVEPGPAAFLTNEGIIFIYNGSNDGIKGDSTLKPGEYTVGQVMFDAKDPSSIIKRCDNYFLKAEHKNETSGQMDNTAFVEALVHFNNKWFIYYTMAEAGIGVATCIKPLD